MKIKEFTENKLAIGIATLGIAIAGGLTYWLFNKLYQSESSQSKQSPDLIKQEQKEKNKPTIQTYDEKFTRIVNQIRALFDANGNTIDQQIMKAVIRGQYELQAEQMKALVHKSRKQRRMLKEGSQYGPLITKYHFDAEEIQEKHLNIILARFNIDNATWKQSISDWQQKNEQGLSDLIRDEEQKLLISYRNENVKPKEFIILQKIFKEIIKKFQVINPGMIAADKTTDEAARYDMIECFGFGVEQEDMKYSISLLNKSQKQKIIPLEDKLGEIIEIFFENKVDEKENDYY